jgi:hypothetical protein
MTHFVFLVGTAVLGIPTNSAKPAFTKATIEHSFGNERKESTHTWLHSRLRTCHPSGAVGRVRRRDKDAPPSSVSEQRTGAAGKVNRTKAVWKDAGT